MSPNQAQPATKPRLFPVHPESARATTEQLVSFSIEHESTPSVVETRASSGPKGRQKNWGFPKRENTTLVCPCCNITWRARLGSPVWWFAGDCHTSVVVTLNERAAISAVCFHHFCSCCLSAIIRSIQRDTVAFFRRTTDRYTQCTHSIHLLPLRAKLIPTDCARAKFLNAAYIRQQRCRPLNVPGSLQSLYLGSGSLMSSPVWPRIAIQCHGPESGPGTCWRSVPVLRSGTSEHLVAILRPNSSVEPQARIGAAFASSTTGSGVPSRMIR